MREETTKQSNAREIDPTSSVIQDTLEDYNNKKTTIPLPEITLAMHPDALYLTDDISDKEQFNERYIESHVHEGMAAFILYLAAMFHNVILVTVISAFVYEVTTDQFDLLRSVILPLLMYSAALIGPYFAFKMASPHPIRFNRQAQMLHYPMSSTEAISLPWREAMPYTRIGRTVSGSHNLMLIFPDPDRPGDPNNPSVLETSVSFDSTDFSSARGNFQRLEFIRRYMEIGIDAIQPSQDAIDKGLVRKPSGYEAPLKFKDGPIFYIIYQTVKHVFYWLGTGPLVDRWLKNKISQFKWPDDVERLCVEGADLSGIDTTPVKSRTDRFYEFHGISELTFVDKDRIPLK